MSNVIVEIAMYLAVVVPALTIFALEYFKPYKADWWPSRRTFLQDLFYLLGIQVVFVVVLKFYLVTQLIQHGFEDGVVWHAWPTTWPIGVQLIAMVAIGEFFQYWWHRLSHRLPKLWAMHGIHHQPGSIYFLNTARFHPLDKSVEFFVDILVFMMLGASYELIAFYYVFYAVNGLLQHANLDLKFGKCNWLLATVENHRIHHDLSPTRAFCNFGNNCMIWDHVFGTYSHYSNTPEQVGALGVQAPKVSGQLFQPVILWGGLNFLVRLRSYWPWWRLIKACKKPVHAQQTVLSKIIKGNQKTQFGLDHGFAHLQGVDDFRAAVTIREYASYQEYLDHQLTLGGNYLLNDKVVYLAKTSGTTGAPKYIPITEAALNALTRSQQISVFSVLASYPELFHGDSFVLVDEEEEETHLGYSAGSMSGKVYGQSPAIIRNKNRVPKSLSEIADHRQRYLVLALAALCSPNVTLFSTANPSTLLKLNSTINEDREMLKSILERWEAGVPTDGQVANAFIMKMLNSYEPELIGRAIRVLNSSADIRVRDYFPNLKIVFCWTKGSCGYPVKTLKQQLPERAHVVEVGLVSSEFRATVNMNAVENLCVPLLEDNFYEFIEPKRYESGERDTLLIEELAEDTEYYLIVTTQSGLYRYFINDIVKTGKKVYNTFSLEFVRKGKGCTNITGEKLTEFDVVSFFAGSDKRVPFFLAVCFPELGKYKLFVESTEPIEEKRLHAHLCKSNLEYKSKTLSGRLPPIEIVRLKQGEGQRYRAWLGEGKGRAWQFKFMHLVYDSDLHFEFDVEEADEV